MHHCDQTMAAYLLDWQAKLGLNIRYQRWSARYTDPAAFRREIELLGPIAGTADECRLPYRDGVQTVNVVHGRPHTGEPVELTVDGETFVVASVEGRRVRLAFDLERLFEVPGEIQPGLILEAVLAVACEKAAQHVTAYDWKAETFAALCGSSSAGLKRE